MKWQCLAVSLDEINAFLASIEKSRDPNEKILKKRIIEDLLPLLQKQEEARKRKAAQKERELLNLEKLATAKRSSRIASKLETQKQEEEAREAERRRQAELAMAKKEQEKWIKLEKERESRMMTREQRLKEREARRILHEEELANLSEDSKKVESGSAGRLSERHLKAEIEKKKQALEELAEEEDWIFDCICGAYGQIDDGTHSIACEKCNIWQHSKCVGVSEVDADREDFHFICKTCERRARDAERAKTHPPIKIKLGRPGSSSSPMHPKQNGSSALPGQPVSNGSPSLISSPQESYQGSPAGSVDLTQFNQSNSRQLAPWQMNLPPSDRTPVVLVPPMGNNQHNGQNIPTRGVPSPYSAPVPNKNEGGMPSIGPTTPYQAPYGSPHGNSRNSSQNPQNLPRPSSSHAFSPPHPHSPTNLAPPGQKHMYSFVNGNAQQYPQSRPRDTLGHRTLDKSSLMQASSSASPPVNGQPLPPNSGNRRSLTNVQSQLSGPPVLSPLNNADTAATLHSSSSALASSPNAQSQTSQPVKFSPHNASAPTQAALLPPSLDPNQALALPPASTGISPTKHSPPRTTATNGSLNSATPSVLPPITSLSPSPRLQNLTPPVKSNHSEFDRRLENGQSLPAPPTPSQTS
jgi:hypothetical protein